MKRYGGTSKYTLLCVREIESMRFFSLANVIEKAKSQTSAKKVAIAGADYRPIIQAAMMAQKDGFVEPIFIGNASKITEMLKELDEAAINVHIVDASEANAAAFEAVRLVREGMADFIMKGMLNTSQILKAVLNKETGLPHGDTVTQVSFIQIPGYHKIVILCDGAIIPYPTLDQKISQINAVTHTLHNMGYKNDIKVAVLCASEEINPKILESIEANQLKQMNLNEEITGCIVEGPISLDIALDRHTAEKKKFESEVAGDADVLLVPSLVAGNLLSKALTSFAGAVSAGMVVGASVPISLTSRVATVEQKYTSLAIASTAAKKGG